MFIKANHYHSVMVNGPEMNFLQSRASVRLLFSIWLFGIHLLSVTCFPPTPQCTGQLIVIITDSFFHPSENNQTWKRQCKARPSAYRLGSKSQLSRSKSVEGSWKNTTNQGTLRTCILVVYGFQQPEHHVFGWRWPWILCMLNLKGNPTEDNGTYRWVNMHVISL